MATIKEIAERAGISIGTVDRIIHNRGRFSDATAERVRQIMAELEYHPNVMARHLSQARSYRLGALLPWPDQDSGYWALPLAGITRAENDVRPFGVQIEVIHFNRYDSASFREAGRRLIDGAYNGVVMAPLLAAETREILEQLSAETSVVFVDTDLPGASRTAYIGQDSYQSGRLAARLMELLTGGAGPVLVLTPDTRNQHLEARIRGFTEHSQAQCRVLPVAVELNQDLEAFEMLVHGELRAKAAGILVTDASAHYAAAILAELSPARRPPLVGYDLVPENRRWMDAGVIDVLLTQRPAAQGYRSIHTLYRRLFLDQVPPAEIYTPIDIVVRENLAYMADEEAV